MSQLELALPEPRRARICKPRCLEVHQRDPGLGISELLPLLGKLKHWGYDPATGLVRVAYPLEDCE